MTTRPVHARCAALIARRGDDAARLSELFDLNWEWRMTEHPEFATYTGFPGQNDRWIDMTPDAIEGRAGDQRRQMEALDSIDASVLDDDDALNAELFRRELARSIEATGFNGEYLAVGPMSGPHSSAPMLLSMMPSATARDFADIVARITGIPALIDQTIELLAMGVKAGITPPRVILRSLADQVAEQADPSTSALMRPFASVPPDLEVDALAREARASVAQRAAPAYGRLHSYLTDTYLPACRESIAWSDLPDGAAWYRFAVRSFTTTDLEPREIHELGLSEVARIRTAMEAIVDAEFGGDFAGFLEFLRTDPRFFFDDAEGLLRAYRDIAKRTDPELVKLFGTLPRLPYGVTPVPSYAERTATTAYYQPGSQAAGRAGYFFANTYDLRARPSWEMEALTLHEAVPGHHLQIALAQELDSLPEFRKHGGFTAFVEGWGLYAESLGEEMGFYQDPYSRFGRLTYEMWRAIRLVVDTGMHAMGWSRQRAIDYFKANTGKSEHDIVVEVDRYIGWAGQALAYKIGELKIKELRDTATDALGDAFDIRAFHDELLGQGALPLDVLERRMRAWCAR